MQGRWALRFGDVPRIDGSIEAESLDAPAVIAAAIGMPAERGARRRRLVAPSRSPGTRRGLNGRIDFKAQRAVFAPWLVAQGLTGVARFNGSEVVFEDVAGELGKAVSTAGLLFQTAPPVSRRGFASGVTDAELGAIFASAERPAIVGPSGVADRDRRRRPQPRRVHRLADRLRHHRRSNRRGWSASIRMCSARSTRAVELGIPTEGNRIREFVAGALDNAGLPVSKASAAISINAGQARLRDIVIGADGADLQATVNVDLADAMLDALLTLNAPPSAPGAVQPAVMVALKGPLPAPKRTVDTNLLTSWLTLRAVEQQSRQIEAMEQAAREAAAAAAAAAPPRRKPPNRRSRRPPRRCWFRNAPAPPAPAPNAAGEDSGSSGAGAAAAGHNPAGAEAACRAARRTSAAPASRSCGAGAAAATRLAELTSASAFRSGRA